MAALPEAYAGNYIIDPVHSEIRFSVRHSGISKVNGIFKDFEGSFHIDPNDPSASKATIAITTDSLDTGTEGRDGHLKSADFFDVAVFPEITFASTSFTYDSEDTVTMVGDLTMHGVTRSVTVEWTIGGQAVDPQNNVRLGFEGTSSIDRRDFDLNFEAVLGGGNLLVGNKVGITFEISGIREEG